MAEVFERALCAERQRIHAAADELPTSRQTADQAPHALGPYSQAIVPELVFCSGMARINPVTEEAAAGIEAQTAATPTAR